MNKARHSVFLWCGLIVLATWAVYLPAVRAGFIWDDQLLVTGNPLLKAGDGLYRIWFGAETPDFFPLTTTTFWLEWHLWGDAPAGYHIVNILLHSLSALLLGFVLSRLGVPGAWVAALVFAVHPVNAASVAWVAERKNTLSMVFYLATILAYLRFLENGKSRGYWWALGMFLLALLAKTSVVMLPLVLLGCVWWLRDRIDRRDIARSLPFFGLSAAFGVLTVLFQHQAGAKLPSEDLALRLARAGWAVWFYAYKALVPVDLCMIYPKWSINTGSLVAWLPALGVIAALVFFWIYRRTWGRPFLFASGYFVITLAPVLGLVYMTFLAQAYVADWWQYTSMPGIIALVTGLATTACRQMRMSSRMVVLAIPVAWLGVATWQQASLYQSMEICCRAIIAKNPQAGAAHDNLGITLAAQGRTAEAIAEYREALRINPDDTLTLNNLGMTLFQLGRFDEAILHYEKIVRLQPEYAQGHANLAAALANRGNLAEAAGQFRMALQLRPERVDFRYNLANALAMVGRHGEAVAQYREVLRVAPRHAQTLTNLARILATNADPQFRRGGEALQYALLANKLTGERNPAIMNTLAAAYAEAGRFDEASQTARQALEIARTAGHAELARSIGERLAAYQAGRPWRE